VQALPQILLRALVAIALDLEARNLHQIGIEARAGRFGERRKSLNGAAPDLNPL
jgi:hypothetical protein